MSTAAERVRDVRERLLAAGTVTPRADGRPRALAPVAIGRAEGRALYGWVRREGARRTLEVGLGFGIAALFICEGLVANAPDARHVAIDPYQFTALPEHATTFAGAGLDVLVDAGVRDLVELHAEESQIVLPRLLAAGRRFDLAFVDGNHRFEGVFLDLVYAGRLLEEGGVVFVDDTQLAAVAKAVRFCVSNLGWAGVDGGAEGEAHEWTVLRTGRPDVFRRPYGDFVEF